MKFGGFCYKGGGNAATSEVFLLRYGEFMTALRRGNHKHVYLLCGEENYYIEKAKERILELLFPGGQGIEDSLQQVEGDMDADELIGRIGTAPFFTDKNVVLLKNTTLFRGKKAGAEEEKGIEGKKGAERDKKTERLGNFLSDMPEYAYVIFLSKEKADKRKKLYRIVENCGAVLETEAVRPWNINEWLQGKLQSMNRTMDRDAELYFAGAVSMMQRISLEHLDREFEKLALFSDERRITREVIADIFSGIPEVSAFALMDAVSARDAGKALMLLRRQMADGTYLPLIFGLLARHVRQLWQAKELQARGYRGKALAKPLELNPVIAERLGRAAERFSVAVLKKAMLELYEGDYLLKTGQAGEEVLEHVVIGLCRKAEN